MNKSTSTSKRISYYDENRPTMSAVDRWVRGAFVSIFAALGFARFDGELRPAHLPLTRAVSPHLQNQWENQK